MPDSTLISRAKYLKTAPPPIRKSNEWPRCSAAKAAEDAEADATKVDARADVADVADANTLRQ